MGLTGLEEEEEEEEENRGGKEEAGGHCGRETLLSWVSYPFRLGETEASAPRPRSLRKQATDRAQLYRPREG